MPTTANTGPFFGPPQYTWNTGSMTSTGPFTFQTAATTDPAPPVALTVSVMADGMLLVDAGWVKLRVPPALFKDLVTLATLGLVEKLAPEEDDVTR